MELLFLLAYGSNEKSQHIKGTVNQICLGITALEGTNWNKTRSLLPHCSETCRYCYPQLKVS